MPGMRRIGQLLPAACLLLVACDQVGGSNQQPLDTEPLLSNCVAAAGCEEVTQTTETLEAGRREDFLFTCPGGRDFLHDWDAAVDADISVHLVRHYPDSVAVRVRNGGPGAGSFALTLGCSDRPYEGEPHHKTMILLTPEPAAAPQD